MWKEIMVRPDTSVVKAIEIIDRGDLQIALVVNEKAQLLGTVTDGDIRRAILSQLSLEQAVRNIMNPKPFYIRWDQSRDIAVSLMRNNKIRQIPVVDEDMCLVGLEIADELLQPPPRHNRVVLMAGGLGQRLHPLTESCPKPLLRVGGKPLLETIMESFIEQGFRYFYISVNYRADMIVEYFGDGSRWGGEIKYIHENQRLGTVGALSLLPETPREPLILMNGDILTKISYGQLLDFHKKNQSAATLCVKEHQSYLPYGVATIEQQRLKKLEEKPAQRYFINAGLYVLQPEVMHYIPPKTCFDMPDLFRVLLTQGKEIAAFPIREYWIDIGRFDDYERANHEFTEVFG